MKQPNLGYDDVKLDFACMHPAGSPRRLSLCVYYDLCELTTFSDKNHLSNPGYEPRFPTKTQMSQRPFDP